MKNLGRRLYERIAGRKEPYPAQYDDHAIEIIERVKPYTMVHPEKLFALIQAVRYVHAHRIPGAIVECGVWRGGCMMAAALTLIERGTKDVEFYLFDTFEGMSKPTDRDRKHTGESSIHEFVRRQTGPDSADWCRATLDDVRQNLHSIGYDQTKFHLVKGKVEDTIPGTIPREIALLRLDTDWYESTKHEMEHLFPRLQQGGVLLIDDYANWIGSKEAVDEYLQHNKIRMLLHNVRLSVVGVKQ